MKCILVRHGESKSNEGDRFTGQRNIPLSMVGIKQAENLKEYILARFTIDKIYASDLIRAYDTVKPIAESLGLSITKIPALREIDGGEWEERKVEELEKLYAEDFALWRKNVGVARCTGGENMAEVQQRALRALREIVKENQGKTVLIGTHAGVLRALECYFQKVPLDGMKDIPWQANTAINILSYEKGEFIVEKLAFTEHLGALVTHLSAKI